MLYIGTGYSTRAQCSGVPSSHRKGRQSVLSKRNECFLVLCRLRLDERDLGRQFSLSQQPNMEKLDNANV
eukprot:m.41374 g.41374  ORF g.41374 m.41374 type:complete len:70 (+) comp33148_c0_seq1:600-809(+)